VLLAGVYALVAVGLTLIFGVMRVVNFAQGEFLMLGMYAAFWAFTLWAFDPYVTLVGAIPLFFLVGLLTYALVMRGVIRASMKRASLTPGRRRRNPRRSRRATSRLTVGCGITVASASCDKVMPSCAASTARMRQS